jgi:hypothetical protein
MPEVTINWRDWDNLTRDLERLGRTGVDAVLRKGAEAAAVELDGFVKDTLPPPVRKQRASHRWTPKQRRWWWATMRDKALGKSQALPGWTAVFKRVGGRQVLVISGGYKRTGTMVRSLDFRVRQTRGAVNVDYGPNVQYAPVVIGEGAQAEYHKGNWPTLQALTRQREPVIIRVFADRALRELNNQLGLR